MTDFNLSFAQKQYDNQEPLRYNRKSICNCYYCGTEIYDGERHAIVVGMYNCCENCIDFTIAREELEFE